MNLKQRVLQLLERIGMSPAEAKFYFAAHQNPQLTIKEIQKKSGFSRTTAYRAFENLKSRGLIVSSPNNWRKNVETLSLREVSRKLAKEQRRLRKVELELESIGDLMGLTAYSHLEDPIEIIMNQSQMQEKAFEMLHKSWDNFLCYGSAERLIDMIGEDAEKAWVRQRVKLGKSVDAYLTEVGEYARYFLPNNHEDHRDVKISIEENNQDHCTYIYNDLVAVWHKDKSLGNRAILIKDPAVIKMYQRMFKKNWKSK